MRNVLFVFLVSLSVIAIGCAGQAGSPRQPEFQPVANVEEIMDGIVIPAAEVVWESVGTTISADGVEEHAPRDDEEWHEVRASALAIAEAGNLLMFESRAKDQGDWIKFCKELIRTAVDAAKAAEKKDAEALLDAGGYVYEACTNCHLKYLPEGQQIP